MPIIIGPIGSNSGGSAGGVSLLDVVLKWPLLAVSEVQNGSFIPTLVALGAGYYVGGGLPGGGQSLQTYAMAYAAAGLGMYGALMVLAPAPVKN